MSDQYDWRHVPYLQDPESYAYNFNSANPFQTFVEQEYYQHKELLNKVTEKRRIEQDEQVDPGWIDCISPIVCITEAIAKIFGTDKSAATCILDTLQYFWAVFKNLVLGDSVPIVGPGTKPDFPCMALGIVGILVIGLALLIVAVYVGPLFSSFFSLLGPIGTIFESILGQLESFVDFMAEYVAIAFYYIKGGWNFIIDWGKRISDWIAEFTGAEPYLVLLNFFTLVAWGLSQLLLELYEVELEWKDSEFYDIFKCINFPITYIKELVEKAAGKGIILDIVRFFAAPFEVGTLLISLLLGGLWFLVKEMAQVVKDHFPTKLNNPK